MVWVTRNGTKMQIPRKLSHHIPQMPIWSSEAFQEKVHTITHHFEVGLVYLHLHMRLSFVWFFFFEENIFWDFVTVSHISKESQKFHDIDSEEFQLYKHALEEEYKMQVFSKNFPHFCCWVISSLLLWLSAGACSLGDCGQAKVQDGSTRQSSSHPGFKYKYKSLPGYKYKCKSLPRFKYKYKSIPCFKYKYKSLPGFK